MSERINMNLKGKVIKIILKLLPAILCFLTLIALTSCMGMPMGSFSSNNDQNSTISQGTETYTVVKGDILQESTTTGSVDVKTTNTYTFEVTGKVISALEQGDSFKKGEVLAELDNSNGMDIINELEDSLLTAEDNLASSKNSLATSKINYQKALEANHIAIQQADLNAQKSQESLESALISLESANISAKLAYESAVAALEKANYENNDSYASTYAINEAQNKLDSTEASGSSSTSQAELNYEKAQVEQSSSYWSNLSSLQSAEEQIKLSQLNINDAELKLKQAERSIESYKEDIENAKKDLENYKILAPYDGIISTIGYKAGEQSSQGGTGISIISDEYIIKATISENDLPKIKVGNEVIISLDAYSDIELNGTVEKINPIATTTNGIVSYEVLINFQDIGDIELFYGLSANLSIIIARAENIIYVPLQSVYTENGKSYVDVLKTSQTDQDVQANQPNKNSQAQAIEKVEVTTGINDYVNIEIKSGINEGDIIVTSKVTQ